MQADTLVKMANQIGDFFDAMPDRDEALQGIAQHLKNFWDPRMRRELLRRLDAGQAGGLHRTVVEALGTHRQGLL